MGFLSSIGNAVSGIGDLLGGGKDEKQPKQPEGPSKAERHRLMLASMANPSPFAGSQPRPMPPLHQQQTMGPGGGESDVMGGLARLLSSGAGLFGGSSSPADPLKKAAGMPVAGADAAIPSAGPAVGAGFSSAGGGDWMDMLMKALPFIMAA